MNAELTQLFRTVRPTDYYGALEGIKPVSRERFIRKRNRRLLEQKLEDEEIYYRKCEISIYGGDKAKSIYYGNDEQDVEKLIELETTENPSREEIGKLLGYPQCCTDAFNPSESRNFLPCIEDLKEAPHYMNPIYNFSARGNSELWNSARCKTIRQKQLNYLPHHPCSLECQESLRKGREIKKILKEEMPAYEELMEKKMSNKVFVQDANRFITFKGNIEDDKAAIDKILENLSITKPGTLDMFEKADKIVKKDNYILLRNSKKLTEVDGKIMSFT